MTAAAAGSSSALWGKRTPTRWAQSVDGLRLRRVLRERSRSAWCVAQPYGPDGWWLTSRDLQVIVSVSPIDDDEVEWVHASMCGRGRVPTYEELTWLHAAAFGDDKYAYQLFVPRSSHVNINEHVLHLWGRLDGKPAMPDFGAELGSI